MSLGGYEGLWPILIWNWRRWVMKLEEEGTPYRKPYYLPWINLFVSKRRRTCSLIAFSMILDRMWLLYGSVVFGVGRITFFSLLVGSWLISRSREIYQSCRKVWIILIVWEQDQSAFFNPRTCKLFHKHKVASRSTTCLNSL